MSTPTPDVNRSNAGGWRGAALDFVRYIPQGDSISAASWRTRHRYIVVLLAVHAPLLYLLGSYSGTESLVTGATFTAAPTAHVLVGVAAIVALSALAAVPALPRRARTAVVSVGLMTASALLVYFSGGFIEAHFHFFVMAGVIAAYEDWLPFAVGILYVAVEHGVFGMTNPEVVYNHPAAVARPMGWMLVHAGFLLALSAALVANWVSIERSREETRDSEDARAEVVRLNERLLVRADELAAAMDAVSKGDFTVSPPVETEIAAIDEISAAFGDMTRELSATLADLRAFAATVESTTQSVYGDAETLERTQTEQAADIREFATGLRDQANTLEATTDELSTLSATIEEIAATADEVSGEASGATAAAESGTATAAEAIEAIEHVERTVGALVDLIESLDDRMDGVAQSTDLIEQIAEQTNMLALNANIEAARAEHGGGGFAVVAEEVKSLADETRNHSAAIEGTVAETIADVERVQQAMAQTKAQLATGKTTMTDAGEAFADLTGTVESVDASVASVATATDDGARTTEDVVQAIERVAERSRTVAEQSEALAERAETSATTVSAIRAELDDLTGQTAALIDQLDAFSYEPASSNDAATADPTAAAGTGGSVGTSWSVEPPTSNGPSGSDEPPTSNGVSGSDEPPSSNGSAGPNGLPTGWR